MDCIMEMVIGKALKLGIKAQRAGQNQKARHLYSAILESQPNHPNANHNMGVLVASVGNLTEALPYFKTALEINPRIRKYWLSYIDTLINMGLITDARAVFDQAKSINMNGRVFDEFEKVFLDKNIHEVQSQDPSPGQLQPIVDLFTQGQIQLALTHATEVLEKFPNSFTTYNIVGAAYAGLMQFDAAIDSYKKAIYIKTEYAEAYNNMGIAYKDKGDLLSALDSYKKALKIDPCFAEAHNNVGVILTDFFRLLEAQKSYKKAIELKPDYAEAHNNLAVILQELGHLKNSEASFRKAISLKLGYAEAHSNLGMLLLDAGDYEEAAVNFSSSNFENSKYYLLRCLYLQNKRLLFYDQLENLLDQGDIHPMIGSLSCRAAIRYGDDRPNLFCKDPLDYVLKTNLNNQYDFEKIFIKTAKAILSENKVINKRQSLLINGYQTAGNLFSLEPSLTAEIQKIIRLEIKKYQVDFKDSSEGLITNWPANYNLYGWLVSMKSGGELKPHMHEKGWISGSIYINVPAKSRTESGNLVVCIEDEQLVSENKNQEKSIDVVTGSLCLFPASLLHYTIPFESNEERIVLAFDLVPIY